MFLHRVGEKRLQHSPFVVIPPHAPLSPVATRLLPVPKHSGCTGCIGCILFSRVNPFFVEFPPFILSIPHFFPFSGEKYAIYAIYATALCFEPKFDRRVKNKVCNEVCKWALDLCKLIPRKCVQSVVKTGADGAVA